MFGSPDGLWFDARGVLWIQTDVSTSALDKGDYAAWGTIRCWPPIPSTREVRRFLTGPSGRRDDGGGHHARRDRRMFVNIQHPGETASERSNPAAPKAVSAWPDGAAGGRPRSATIVIRKTDGGIIGA